MIPNVHGTPDLSRAFEPRFLNALHALALSLVFAPVKQNKCNEGVWLVNWALRAQLLGAYA
jgi:hypothetical protein